MGVDKRIIAHGEGSPITSGHIVTVHCTGFGKNNDLSKQFWSTKDTQRLICPIPLSFEVGQGHVIKGWDEGVLGMQHGEVARLTCTPDYAFGGRGYPAWGIGPNSILEFEIEVLATDLKNHQPKLKRKMKHSSSGADEMDGGMTSHQPMPSSARVESGAVAYRKIVDWDYLLSTYKSQNSRYSKMALKCYNENQPDKFELVRAWHAQKLLLFPPGPIGDYMEEWCHLFFVGRSKKDHTVQKHFFAELMKLNSETSFKVKSCSTLEPGDYGDFDHGCIICPPGLLLHPRRGLYFDHILLYRPVTWVMR